MSTRAPHWTKIISTQLPYSLTNSIPTKLSFNTINERIISENTKVEPNPLIKSKIPIISEEYNEDEDEEDLFFWKSDLKLKNA